MDISPQNCRSIISERLKTGGLFHAMIVTGSDGPEKTSVINALAAAALCSGDRDRRPCGECAHCKKVKSGIHPDVIVTDILPDKREILAEQARSIRTEAHIIPNDAENKVFIIKNADKMNETAQNILLKTLEEPPRFSYFILSAENPAAMLQTVRSRCAMLVCRSGESIDSAAAEKAKELIDAYLSGDRIALVSFINRLETRDKIDRKSLGDMAQAARKEIALRMRDGEKRDLSALIRVMDEVLVYTDANVSPVHTLGLMLAKLV